MKRFFIIIISLLLIFCGCSKNTTNEKLSPTESVREDLNYDLTSYTLSRENEKWYIDFKEGVVTQKEIESCMVGDIPFPDMDTMIKSIKEDNFTRHQRAVIYGFYRENGRTLIFDLDNVATVAYPESYTIEGVVWCGEEYDYVLKGTDDSKFVMQSFPEYIYAELYEYLITDHLSKKNNISKESFGDYEVTVCKTTKGEIFLRLYEKENFCVLEEYHSRHGYEKPYDMLVFRKDKGVFEYTIVYVGDYHYTPDELEQIYLYYPEKN